MWATDHIQISETYYDKCNINYYLLEKEVPIY
jgi:hypothetical protein